jgi:hypothetical protein
MGVIVAPSGGDDPVRQGAVAKGVEVEKCGSLRTVVAVDVSAARALADETVNIAYCTIRADTAGLIHELARIGKG